MAAMKECPSCGAEVPTSAKRCKECFHDFEELPPSKGIAGPIALLVSVAGMVLVSLVALVWIVMQPQDAHTFVDQDTQSIIWTRTYVTGTTTDRIEFKDVQRLEYVVYASGTHEIAAVGVDGSRRVVLSSESPLRGDADKFAALMEKPVVTIDNTRGFGGN